jgi:hypothetical protein
VKAVDDGAFAESLRSTLIDASVSSGRVPTASAQPTQPKQEKREQQTDVEEQVTSAVSSVTPASSNAANTASNAANPSQTQDSDQTTTAAAAKKTTAKVTALQKDETKSTKDVAAQDTDAAPVQTAVDASKEIVQTPQVAIVPVVPVTVESSNPVAQKVQSDGTTKIDASSASGASPRAAKPDLKKLESVQGTNAAPTVATQSSATATTGAVQAAVPLNGNVNEGTTAGGTGLAVVAHAIAANSATPVAAAPGVSHTEAVAAAAAPVDSPDVQTLVATQKVLEIGVASDSHGWLRVRAQVDSAGEISAAVVATSAGAAEGLHRELPAISAYLAGEQVGLSSLVVHAAGSLAATQDAMYGSASGAGAGAESSGGPSAGKDSNQAASNPLPAASGDSAEGADLDVVTAMSSLPSAVFSNGTGSWLSVRV